MFFMLSTEEDYGQKQLERLLDVEDRGHDRETVNGQAKEIYNCARVQGHDMVEGVFLCATVCSSFLVWSTLRGRCLL